MGQMADGRRHIIVLPVVQNQRNGAHCLYQRGVAFQLPAGDIPGGGQDIIGIFKKRSLGVLVADPLAASHGMPADEAGGQAQLFDVLVDRGFYASHIGEDTAVLFLIQKKRTDEQQITVILGDGGA